MSEVKFDIIINSLMRWDQSIPGASLDMARELSKHHRVFFIDRPYSIKDLFLEYETTSIRKRLAALIFRKNPFLEVETGFSQFVVATPGITLPINFLPKGVLFEMLNAFNSWVVKLCIKRMARKYKINNYVYINYFNPVLLPTLYLGRKRKFINVYYVFQDVRLTRYIARHGERAEKRCLSKADLVLVSSRNQFKRLFNENKHMYYFANAVDFHMFEQARIQPLPKPYDLLNIGSTRIIMFCGYLSDIRIDYKLLKLVCENFPQYLVILIGYYEEKDLIHYELELIPNLIFLGNRRREAIPAYLKCAGVTIIPYLCNELNKNVNPLKMNEYLAMGKPVVSTDFSPDLEAFESYIYLASSYQEFLNYIELALEEDNDSRIKQRVRVAEQNSWKYRYSHFKLLLDQVEQYKYHE